MLCLGFRRQGHPGVICRQVMEIGKSLLLFLSLAHQRRPGRLLEEQIDNFEFKLLMINAGHIKDHLHGSGARGGKQDMAKTRGSSAPRYVWSWMRMVYLCLECIRNCPAHALSLNPPHVCRLGSRTCRYAECDPVKCTHMARGLSTEVWPGAVFNPNVDVPVEEARSRMGHYDDLWNRRDARIRISEHAEATYGATPCGRCMAFCTAGHDAMNRRMRPCQTVYLNDEVLHDDGMVRVAERIRKMRKKRGEAASWHRPFSPLRLPVSFSAWKAFSVPGTLFRSEPVCSRILRCRSPLPDCGPVPGP